MLAGNVRALCRCGIRIPSARNRCLAFDKVKYLEPMFGDVGQARTKAAIMLLLIATTSSRTCTKPIVSSCIVYHVDLYFGFLSNLKRVEERKLSQGLHKKWLSGNSCILNYKTLSL